jgi:diaminohydroxyphosphoribosylaminopyrimidine deaminase/5-amino-6-(5-phosphoribosylamino)uracil reductase
VSGRRGGGPTDAGTDALFMQRALRLARRGGRATRPNPMVGAVIVRDGKVLAEGYHRRAGAAHAEVDALARVGGRAPGATLYVTLEPCCHTGRTPPCTQAVLASGIARVVVAVRDPNPLVDGRGIATLRRAGVSVEVGCQGDACRELNRAFFLWIQERRPLVTMKVAATWDGFIADGRPRRKAAPVWLTGADAREAAHVLRGAHDAILVGAGTVQADDPQLTDRRVGRPRARPGLAQPLRVVLDGRLSIDPRAAVLRRMEGTAAPTLVFGAKTPATAARAVALRAAGAEVLLLRGRGGRLPMIDILRVLASRQVQSLLVEGGADVHGAFIEAGLVDRVALFLAPLLLGSGTPVARSLGRSISDALRLGPPRVRPTGDDLLLEADVLR